MSARSLTVFALLAASNLSSAPAAIAQPTPVGPRFQVNSYVTGPQFYPGVAVDGAGNIVVVWGSGGQDGDDYGVFGQRFDTSATPLGAEFQVNSYTTYGQNHPAVASDGAGNFVIVWEDGAYTGSDEEFSLAIRAKRFDSSGTLLGSEFQVNTYTTGDQRRPIVTMDGGGNFIVVWVSDGSAGTDTDGDSIQGQRYDTTGTPLGGQFQVNSYTTNNQYYPAVSADAAGNFVVAWESAGSPDSDTDDHSIQAQRFNAAGVPIGSQFQVNSYTTTRQQFPAVAANASGAFVVTWDSYGSDGSDADVSVQAQQYDSAGSAVGGQFQVNTYTTGSQSWPQIGVDAGGNFVVVWQSSEVGSGLTGQRYDSSGVPVGGEFTADPSGFAQFALAVRGSTGDFIVAFPASPIFMGEDTSGTFAQRFSVAPFTTSTTSTSTSSTSSTTLLTDLLPGRIVIIKPGTLAKFVAKPSTGDTFALPTGSPVAVGGTLRIFDTSATAGNDNYALPTGGTPPLGWKGLGNPAGSKGYKYKGAGTVSDPCKAVLVKETVIKGICKGAGITLAPPFTGDVAVVLNLGSTDTYCAQFDSSGEIQNDSTLTKRKNVPAPAACP